MPPLKIVSTKYPSSPSPKVKPHFNLYGLEDEEEVMFTKDHIIPKSKGGRTHISNMQTMCSNCNNAKGNRLRLVMVKSEGWEGVYDECGRLMAEGISLSARDMLDALGHEVVSMKVAPEYARSKSLPKKIGKLKVEEE